MTVKELKEKLNEFDESLIVMIPNNDMSCNENDMAYVPAESIVRGVNELDGCLFIDNYVEE